MKKILHKIKQTGYNMSKYCKAYKLRVTYLDCMECETKECKAGKEGTKLMSKMCCGECVHLRKREKQYKVKDGTTVYKYGCALQKGGYAPFFFVEGEPEKLSECGCGGCCNKMKYGTVFGVEAKQSKPKRYIYLGVEKRKRCIFNVKTKEVESVASDWIKNKNLVFYKSDNLYITYADETDKRYFISAENLQKVKSVQLKKFIRDNIVTVTCVRDKAKGES